ncbi:MAG: hypothetical protein KKA19_06140, partial [Candidatus Margulisbacteria bacterium]|nr:hypothetical protein [Candidatus Margulisiibacteriota bacterium]
PERVKQHYSYERILAYTKNHLWYAYNGDLLQVGISKFAIAKHKGIVNIELWYRYKAEEIIKKDTKLFKINTNTGPFYLAIPFDFKVIYANSRVYNLPLALNNEPYNENWIIQIEPVQFAVKNIFYNFPERFKLMSWEKYMKYIESEKKFIFFKKLKNIIWEIF